eukprot:161770-Chlamydomonas_euryale.AAC.2
MHWEVNGFALCELRCWDRLLTARHSFTERNNERMLRPESANTIMNRSPESASAQLPKCTPELRPPNPPHARPK